MNTLLAEWYGVPVVLVTGDDVAVAEVTLIPEIAEAFPNIRRVGPETISFSAETMPAAYRLIRVLYRFISAE